MSPHGLAGQTAQSITDGMGLAGYVSFCPARRAGSPWATDRGPDQRLSDEPGAGGPAGLKPGGMEPLQNLRRRVKGPFAWVAEQERKRTGERVRAGQATNSRR